MTRLRLMPCCLCFLVLTAASCGSILDTLDDEGPRLFGGLRTDIALGAAAFGPGPTRPWWMYPGTCVYLVVDIPLSLGADLLLLLPYSGLATWLRSGNISRPE